MSDQITVTLPDGSSREYATGTTPAEVAASIGKGLAKAAIAAKADGEWIDLSRPLGHDTRLQIVVPDSDDGREVLRHSTAHVMAEAVTRLFPGAKVAIGPAIADGFYYDFDLPDGATFSDDDLERIEAEMRTIVKADQRFARDELTYDDALELFSDQPYKREIIEKVRGGAGDADDAGEAGGNGAGVSVYRNMSESDVCFTDLCRGPHVPST
ncbi:MAG TPA: TGS domain-containing protein, partial [Acidimicrobiia bacterium]|nr:TGS domain-containing protein [Acidimicrobiia bacterium]